MVTTTGAASLFRLLSVLAVCGTPFLLRPPGWSALAADAASTPTGPKPGIDQCLAGGFKEWQPVRGQVAKPPPDVARPVKGIPVIDPVFGTCVVRVTEHDGEPPRGFARNDYSRRQAFNADNSRLLIIANDGAWHLYDAASLAHLRTVPAMGGDAEPQWHPTNPDLLYFLPRNGAGMTLHEFDVRSNNSRVIVDLGPRLRKLWPSAHAAWTRSEGSPSADLRYWVFQIDDAAWRGLGMVTYDLSTDTILASYDFAKHGKPRPDHVSMSPSGAFVVVSWDHGPVVLDRDLANPRPLASRGEHSDIAIDAAGNDVYVSVDYGGRGGPVYMTDLRTGKRTDLFDTYVDGTATAMHFSGKAYRQPGWVVISTYGDYRGGNWLKRPFSGDGFKWPHRKIFAVQLRANPAIVNLAFHHGIYAKYWTEPQASASRDLTRVLFNSNWGTSSETDVDAYMIVLPRGLAGVRH